MASTDVDGLVRLFIDDMTDYAVVVVDSIGKILTWNAGARALLGYAEDEAVGRNFTEFYARLDPTTAESHASVTDAVQWGRHETNRMLVRKDGTRLQINLVLRPISDPENKVVGFGLIAHDIDKSRRIAAAVPAPPSASPPRPHGTARILVVDDNKGVLGIAVDQLTSLGYQVFAASSGEEAFAILLQDDQIDLLFTDVVMPGELAGRALAAKALELRPYLKVLFSSGYFEGALVGKGQLEANVHFLPKPYRKHELAQKVKEVLSRAS
jgi:PAS domain S-box-containing protein